MPAPTLSPQNLPVARACTEAPIAARGEARPGSRGEWGARAEAGVREEKREEGGEEMGA